jgi:polysaccharide pyruvyl transferase WcaK-like protein
VHVATTYHSAVFALSQGIPVVAMSGSAYYDNKLLGLRGQFGEGCAVLETSDGALAARVEAAVDEAWENAPRLRTSLLEAADSQIRASREAYGRALDLIESSVAGAGG